MSQAGQIDGLQFAQECERRSGHLELEAFPRLAEFGCLAARVDYEIEGCSNAEGRLALRVTIDGVLELECQRCLGSLEHAAAVRNELELAVDPAFIESAEDDVDRVLATPNMEVSELIEDELILSLPMVPMHETCDLPAEAERSSPFAALAALKKGNSEG